MHSTHLSYHAMIKPDWMGIHTKIEMVFALAIFNYEFNYETVHTSDIANNGNIFECVMESMEFISALKSDSLFTISLEMPVPSQRVITVFTVFRLLTEFCLFI